jgi:hypothetical protein
LIVNRSEPIRPAVTFCLPRSFATRQLRVAELPATGQASRHWQV